jgi:hypothetical protein
MRLLEQVETQQQLHWVASVTVQRELKGSAGRND